MLLSRRLSYLQSIAGVFLFWVSLYIYVPNLPVYAQSKSADLALVGSALAQYGLWQAVARLPLGISADWLGLRKPFILLGLAFSVVGALIMAAAGDASGLALGRALTGFAAAAWVPLIAAYSSLFPPEEAARAATILTLVNSIGRMLASLLTGPLFALGGYQLEFYAAAAAAGLGLVVMGLGREPRRPPLRPSLGVTGRLVLRRDVLGPALLNAVLLFANYASTFTFIPILAKNLGGTSLDQGALITLNLLMYAVGNFAASALIRRLGEDRLVYFAFVGMAVGIAAAAVVLALPAVYLLAAVLGLAGGVGYPILMGQSIAHVQENDRGTALGLHQAVYAIGMFAGPWCSGILAEAFGLPVMFGIVAAAALLLGCGGAWLLNRRSA